jgi:hypothetical protein
MLTWAIMMGFVVLMAWPLVTKIASLRETLRQRKALLATPPATSTDPGPYPSIQGPARPDRGPVE